MGTKAIAAVLDGVAHDHGEGAVRKAVKELEAIRTVAREWVAVDGQPGPGKMRRLDALLRAIAKEAP